MYVETRLVSYCLMITYLSKADKIRSQNFKKFREKKWWKTERWVHPKFKGDQCLLFKKRCLGPDCNAFSSRLLAVLRSYGVSFFLVPETVYFWNPLSDPPPNPTRLPTLIRFLSCDSYSGSKNESFQTLGLLMKLNRRYRLCSYYNASPLFTVCNHQPLSKPAPLLTSPLFSPPPKPKNTVRWVLNLLRESLRTCFQALLK